MTDTSSLLTTHSTPQLYPVTAPSLASPLPNGSLSDANPQEEEDYTIKCICAYADDDGNTVYCERCDTWQHIECYYHGKKVPEVHFCADCFPRELDAKRATERQKRVREQIDGGDRKVKARPASKSHKKKTKDVVTTTEQINGWHSHERHESLVNGRDQPPPTKKPKTSHRSSGSIASVNGHGLPESRKRASSNVQSYPSPSKSPQELYRFPSVPTYTPEFLELYDRDEGERNVSPDGANVYTIPASNKLSAWRMDPSLWASEKGANPNSESPFVYSELRFDSSIYPDVSLEISNSDVEFEGTYPTWRLLRIQKDVKKDDLVGEIRGQVGLLEDYCKQGSMNRWTELRHPDPFVFFHPHMNIYIDSRREGTQFRYLRRSCRPNVTLRTFVSADGEYHHCFVASKDISAGTELTTHWYLDPSTFNNDPLVEDGRSKKVAWASRILANFGDCACDRTQACYLAQLDHRYSPKSLEILTRAPGRKKKTKAKHAISPLSTGQATNSRAGSEAVKVQDDDDQYDRRSTSTSSHSHPESRDMTPTQLGSLDADPVLGSTMTARERKKLAAVEKAFERAEQSQGQRKKKRTSGGPTLNTPGVNVSRQSGFGSNSNPTTPNVTGQLYTELKTSRPFSGSPPPLHPKDHRRSSDESPCRPGLGKTAQFASSTRAQPAKPAYVDAKIQTEPEEPETFEMPPSKRRKFSTPTQRLLRRVLEDRAKYDQLKVAGSSSPASSPVNFVEQIRQGRRKSSTDIETKDASVSVMSTPDRSPLESPKAHLNNVSNSSPTYPLPSQVAHSQKSTIPPGGPRLHLATLPPVPSFTGGNSALNGVGVSGTPVASASSTVQSPLTFSCGQSPSPGLASYMLATPSPVRKKLSLVDYMSRKNLSSTPVVEKTQAHADAQMEDPKPQESTEAASAPANPTTQPAAMIKPNETFKEEAVAMDGVDGTAVDDTPMKDDSDYSPPDASPVNEHDPIVDLVPFATPASATIPPSQTSIAPPIQPPRPPPPGSSMSPELANVLATLQQFSAMQEKGRSKSTSSS
jgi:uncharacterized protein